MGSLFCCYHSTNDIGEAAPQNDSGVERVKLARNGVPLRFSGESATPQAAEPRRRAAFLTSDDLELVDEIVKNLESDLARFDEFIKSAIKNVCNKKYYEI